VIADVSLGHARHGAVERRGVGISGRIDGGFDHDAEATGRHPLAVAADHQGAGPLREHSGARRETGLTPEPLDGRAVTVDVSVHHESDELVALEGSQELAEAVLGRNRVDGELALGLAHRRRQPAIQLNPATA
jgi:hypothetical protein